MSAHWQPKHMKTRNYFQVTLANRGKWGMGSAEDLTWPSTPLCVSPSLIAWRPLTTWEGPQACPELSLCNGSFSSHSQILYVHCFWPGPEGETPLHRPTFLSHLVPKAFLATYPITSFNFLILSEIVFFVHMYTVPPNIKAMKAGPLLPSAPPGLKLGLTQTTHQYGGCHKATSRNNGQAGCGAVVEYGMAGGDNPK